MAIQHSSVDGVLIDCKAAQRPDDGLWSPTYTILDTRGGAVKPFKYQVEVGYPSRGEAEAAGFAYGESRIKAGDFGA